MHCNIAYKITEYAICKLYWTVNCLEVFVFKQLTQEGSMNIISALKAVTKITLIIYHVVTSDLSKSRIGLFPKQL